MATPPPPLVDDDAMFRRLAEMDLAWAEKVHAKAMAATEVDEINSLGRTYQRAARSLRQTLALKARLKAGRVRQAREARVEQTEAERTEARARRQREFNRLIGRPDPRGDWREASDAYDVPDDSEDEDEAEDVLPDDASEAGIRAWMDRRGMDPADPEVIRLFELFEFPLPKPLASAPAQAADPLPARPPNGHDSG